MSNKIAKKTVAILGSLMMMFSNVNVPTVYAEDIVPTETTAEVVDYTEEQYEETAEQEIASEVETEEQEQLEETAEPTDETTEIPVIENEVVEESNDDSNDSRGSPEEEAEEVVEETTNTIQITYAGQGTVTFVQNGESITLTGNEEYQEYEVTGAEGEKVEIIASANDGNTILWFAQFGFEYGDYHALVDDKTQTNVSYTATFGEDQHLSVGFGVDTTYGSKSPRRLLRASNLPDPTTLPSSGSGTLWTNNTDVESNTFTITSITGTLGVYASQIVGKTAVCIDPGKIAVTSPNAYGTTYLNYTYTIDQITSTYVRITITSDYLRDAWGNYAYGYDRNGYYDRYQRMRLTVDLTIPRKTVTVNLDKNSGVEAITDGNPEYSLEGAVYGVYIDEECTDKLGEITTDSDGIGSFSGSVSTQLGVTRLFVKELVAPKGYILDETVYTAMLNNDVAELEVTDKAANDPFRIRINKISEDGVENVASLEGAEFTINYYDGQYSSIEDLPNSATRTWVIKTIERNGKYEAYLDENYFVSGDEFYKTENGSVTLPLGTITVQETKAPENYLLEGATLNNQLVSSDDNGMVLMNIVEDSESENGGRLVGGNEYTVTEKVSRGGIEVQKNDSVTRTTKQGDVTDFTTTYEIRNNNSYDVVAKAADGSTVATVSSGESFTITTDSNGHFNSGTSFLPLGKYTITEVNAPTGMKLEGNISYDFEITSNQEVIDMTTQLDDDSVRGSFTLRKNDADLGAAAQGNADLEATFELINVSENPVVINGKTYAVNEQIMTFKTDSNGTYTAPKDYLVYGSYLIREIAAPRGYTIEGSTQTTFSIRNDGQVVALNTQITNEIIRGGFEIQKNDADLGKQPQGDTPNLQASFEVINESANPVVIDGKTYAKNEVVFTFTTDESGYYKSAADLLAYGSYRIRETKAPTGYKNTGKTELTFDITVDGKIESLLTEIENNVVTGGFTLRKNDIWYGTRSLGDTNLSALFELVNTGANPVVVDGKTYAPGERITTFRTNADGSYTSEKNLPYSSYEVNEIDPPVGYTTDGVRHAEFQIRNEQEVIDITNVISNRVDLGRFSLRKVTTYSSSAAVDPEAGVEFTAILASKIDALGGFDAAYAAIKANANENGDVVINDEIVLAKYEYAVVVTDAEGNAISGDLAYGTYTMKQTSHYPETIDFKDDITFVVEADQQPMKQYTVTNEAIQFYLRIVKTDSQTGNRIFNDGASFKITDEDGTPVTMKLGRNTYDTFRTASNADLAGNAGRYAAGTYVVAETEDDLGEVVTPLTVNAGTYFITEIEAPEGFIELDEPIKLVVTEKAISEVDEDGTPIQTTTVSNTQITGEIEIIKTIEDYEADKSLIEREDLSYITFKLVAAEDIINKDTGAVLTAKGALASDIYGNEVGAITLDRDGYAKVVDLPLGKYTLIENVPAGFTAVADRSVEFTQEDNTTKVYSVSEEYENTTTKVEVSKTLVTGEEELPGAQLEITNSNGESIDSWTSTTKTHTVEGLTVGEVYTLTEVIAPEGVVKATSIEFTVNEDGSVTHVHMVDELFTVQKVDMCGVNVDGAVLAVYDVENLDGDPVDTWTTQKDVDHKVSGLVAGKTYVVKEVVVPAGYVKMADKTFTVVEDGKDETLTLIDKQIEISKEDVGGREVEGAHLEIRDKSTGEVVDSWTSGKNTHYANNLEVGKEYTLSEVTAPHGFVKASDIDFVVTDNGIDQKVTMIDEIISVRKVTEDGTPLEGAEITVYEEDMTTEVESWKTGSAIIDELTDEQIETLKSGKTVTISDDGTTFIKVYPVVEATDSDSDDSDSTEKTEEQIKKEACEVKQNRDDTTSDDAAITIPDGADLKYQVVIKNADGSYSYSVIDESGREIEHMISGLVRGKSYIIVETATVDGRYYATDVKFTADGKNQTVTMVDNSINYQIVKVDDKDGSYVEGVTLKLWDITEGEENAVEVTLPNDGVTTGEPFDVNLNAEHTYKLEESEYVAGVYKATDITFTVPKYGTSEITTITMMDETTNISVRKVDNHGNTLPGATMQVIETTTDEEGNVIAATDEEGNEIVVYEFTSTDVEHGTDISEYVKGGETYILRESEVPFGFEAFYDITFTVDGKIDTAQVIVATDVRKTVYVSAIKVDAQDSSKKLSGATITLFNNDGTIATDIDGKECVAVTDGEGVVTFAVEYNDDLENGGYYVQETAAPTGYRINNNKFAVELTEDYDFAVENPVVIVVNDEALPTITTGIGSNIFGYTAVMACAALIGLLAILKLRKHKA